MIAPTEKVRALLEGYGVSAPVKVIPTGIDLDAFSAPLDPEKRAGMRRALGIPEGDRVLVYVGRLAREKNLEEVLECRAALSGNVTLLLVGDGPERATLEEKAEVLGIRDKVVFAGMVARERVADYYRLGDVFVSASSSETQGLTYAEALAAGLPALCRADPCLDGVIQNGSNGWQYQSREELARRLSELLADGEELRAMGGRAAFSAGKFSARRFAQSAEEWYEQALAARRGPAWAKGAAAWQKAW